MYRELVKTQSVRDAGEKLKHASIPTGKSLTHVWRAKLASHREGGRARDSKRETDGELDYHG